MPIKLYCCFTGRKKQSSNFTGITFKDFFYIFEIHTKLMQNCQLNFITVFMLKSNTMIHRNIAFYYMHFYAHLRYLIHYFLLVISTWTTSLVIIIDKLKQIWNHKIAFTEIAFKGFVLYLWEKYIQNCQLYFISFFYAKYVIQWYIETLFFQILIA